MSGVLQQIVVMGVSGAGKSTTGEALARRMGWPRRMAGAPRMGCCICAI